jgi:23S rRNA pseudouridine2604 synthase
VTEIFLNGMASGVRILGTVTKPCKIRRVDARTFRIILTQGLNRQIRRMCSFFGYKVVRLQRVRIINITVDGLKAGQWRELKPDEVRGLLPHKPGFNF